MFARSKKAPQLAALLVEHAPDLIDPLADDMEAFNVAGSGLSCDECGDPAEWFDGTRILCGAHHGR